MEKDNRICYKLWQFLESYDELGYTIDARDSALEFDEEYLIQLYNNLITNYIGKSDWKSGFCILSAWSGGPSVV
ncbi:MAG: hypothetical protein SPJ81_00045 [Lachnoclostridium sp.]|nr:hypothetical protein [Lachnoclostridium sp.]